MGASEPKAAVIQPQALPQGSAGWRYAGWSNLAAGFVCSVLLVGSTIYSFGLYVVPFNEAFGLTRRGRRFRSEKPGQGCGRGRTGNFDVLDHWDRYQSSGIYVVRHMGRQGMA